MRIYSTSTLSVNGELKAKLKSSEGEVNLDVRAIWTHKIRFRHHKAGLHFIQSAQETLETLKKILVGSEHWYSTSPCSLIIFNTVSKTKQAGIILSKH